MRNHACGPGWPGLRVRSVRAYSCKAPHGRYVLEVPRGLGFVSLCEISAPNLDAARATAAKLVERARTANRLPKRGAPDWRRELAAALREASQA